MSYKYLSGFFTAYQGQECFWQAWVADPSFRRNLVVNHGLGEHSGCYKNVLDCFSKEGVNIFSYDMRGHGKSKGQQGDVASVTQLSYDLEAFLAMLEREFHCKKPVLCGHSLGGLVALHFALAHTNQWHLKALVVNGSALRSALNFVQRIKVFYARMLSFLLQSRATKIIISSSSRVEDLSHDADAIKDRENDSLLHNKISIGLGLSVLDGGAEVLGRANQLKIPILISHGQEDRVIDCKGSIELYDQVSSQEKQLQIYPGMYHETYNEDLELRQQVLQDLKQFVLSHLPA